ncbi:TPA: hypothetical protein I9786_000403 [Serratia marcescens]|nr:hypothetical protein [Serratia marcescens]HAT5029139.1 hypothetical protein [Serratia marcescens]
MSGKEGFFELGLKDSGRDGEVNKPYPAISLVDVHRHDNKNTSVNSAHFYTSASAKPLPDHRNE